MSQPAAFASLVLLSVRAPLQGLTCALGHASVSFLGMVRFHGDLDPETGETLLTALRAVLDAESRSPREDDDRTPAQRRVDALGEICRGWLDSADRPTVAGERPHVTVMVDVAALRDPSNDPLSSITQVPSTSRRRGCWRATPR